MRKLTHVEKSTIKTYIKNGLDIGKLIQDKDIKGEDFSHAIIKSFNWVQTDISNCNFASVKFGMEGQRNAILNSKMRNCNFCDSEFYGKVWVRNCDARNCNFKGANIANTEYQHTDFRGSSFCDAIIRINTRLGIGCRFPISMFTELCKGWKMKITAEEQ